MKPEPTRACRCCKSKPELGTRPVFSATQAGKLSDLFKVLASDTRLRLLHALVRADELCVSELAEAVGMKPQAVSNQLQRLSNRGIVSTRRNGTQIHYRIVDPCVTTLLDRGLCLLEEPMGHRS